MRCPRRTRRDGGSPTSSSASLPAGSQDAAELVEDAGQVSEVANGEPAHDAVGGARAQRQGGRVGLDEGSASGAGCGEHPEGEIDPERSPPCAAQLACEIACPAPDVEHDRVRGDLQAARSSGDAS